MSMFMSALTTKMWPKQKSFQMRKLRKEQLSSSDQIIRYILVFLIKKEKYVLLICISET